MNRYYYANINLAARPAFKYSCKQGDTVALGIKLNNMQTPQSLTGTTVTLNAVLADNTAIIQQTGITVSEYIATIIFDGGITADPGNVKLEAVFSDFGGQISTYNFTLSVEAALISDNTVSDDVSDGIITALTLASCAPYIGENGNWYQYDAAAGTFTDTGISASGSGGGGGGSYTLPTAAADTLGGIKVGANLKITDGVLSVDTATVVEADNTKPVTSAAVNTQVGNIEVLLAAI